MEYRKVFLLSVVVFLSACAGKNVEQPVTVEFEPVESEYPITIPFEAGVGVEREIKLSDIADSVQYVPLETNDKCLIDFINSGKVVKTGKYWFVSSNTRLYQYTTDGKFVRNIGSRVVVPDNSTISTDRCERGYGIDLYADNFREDQCL